MKGKHGLGFVIGDEGAGTWFGKALVTDFLYGLMPPEISLQNLMMSIMLDKESCYKKCIPGTKCQHLFGCIQ